MKGSKMSRKIWLIIGVVQGIIAGALWFAAVPAKPSLGWWLEGLGFVSFGMAWLSFLLAGRAARRERAGRERLKW